MTGNGVVEAAVDRLTSFLKTGAPPPGLFSADVFCDLTVPRWRHQAQGLEDVVALRTTNHPGGGSVSWSRCDPTARGFVLELEERWQDGSDRWYCREMFRADLDDDGAIVELSVYCTGDWDEAQRDRHAREVALLR